VFVARPARHDTKDRLVAAASTLFAERGFHGTTVRDIAERAGANVAAGNYHYGSKKALYLEVLRAQFALVRGMLVARGASPKPNELARLGRPALVRILRARVKVMLDILIGPPPGVHGTLMQREMADPSEAMPVIVAEFIRPMVDEMKAIVAQLVPALDRRSVELCVHSIIGQGLFYRSTMPALLVMFDVPQYPRGLAAELAEHITEFSLGGLERLAAPGSRGRRAR
jgi:TetR/AcrR family transcriptional regulator, regulator of cefoperazone and chloramphenicol sensitivity